MTRARAAAATLAAAIVAVPLLLTVLLAQSGFAFCSRRVAIEAMPAMHGMPMATPTGGGFMVCPIAIALIVAVATFAGAALVALARSHSRAALARRVARRFAALPPLPTAGVLSAIAALPVAAMARSGASAQVDGVAALVAVGAVVLGAVATAALLIVVGRCLLAVGRRVIACVLVLSIRRVAPPLSTVLHLSRRTPSRRTRVLTAFRGLRAPPFAH